jgi:hypothetical protein
MPLPIGFAAYAQGGFWHFCDIRTGIVHVQLLRTIPAIAKRSAFVSLGPQIGHR